MHQDPHWWKTFSCRWEGVTENMPLPPDPAGTKKPRKGLRSQRAAGASRASKSGTDGRVGRSSSWSNSSGWRGQSDFGGSTVISPTGVTVRGGSCFKWHWSNVCNSWGGFFATLHWMPDLVVIPKELLGHRLSSIVKINPWTTYQWVSGYLVEKGWSVKSYWVVHGGGHISFVKDLWMPKMRHLYWNLFRRWRPIFISSKINFLVPNRPNDLLVFKLDSSIWQGSYSTTHFLHWGAASIEYGYTQGQTTALLEECCMVCWK
jgi:hypothetical protein